MTGSSLEIAPSLDYTEKRQALGRHMLSELAAESGSLLVDPLKSLCDAQQCHAMLGGTVLYQDGDHLSRQGAEFLAPLFDPVLAAMQDNTGR